MTDWTSISVTEEQKEIIDAQKPEGMARGQFVVNQLESNESNPNEEVEAALEAFGHPPSAESVANEVIDSLDTAAFNGGISDDRADDIIREIRKLQELVEQAPNKTADRFEEKFR